MTEDAAELTLVLIALASLQLHWLGVRRRRRYASRRGASPDLEKVALLVLVAVTMVLIPLLDLFVPWFEFADLVFLDEVAWIGLGLGSAAVWLFWRAETDWQRFCRRQADALVDRGIYRHLRHPHYAAMLLWTLAQLLLLQNWLAGPAAALTFAIVYLLRVPLEEQHLLERHGHHYLDYMERTGGILPRWPRDR